MPGPIDALVLGASGYVGGEFLRLLAVHPVLRLKAALSHTCVDQKVTELLPQLQPAYPELRFSSLDALDAILDGPGPLAVFGAAPHGESASILDDLITKAAKMGREVSVVDTSADFRFPSVDQYEEIYDQGHGAPARISDFHCALPDLTPETPGSGPLAQAIAHPGCFTTAVTLACAPLHALQLVEPEYFVSAVTGSTGSGRHPKAGTHHPERHGNLRAYSPLVHRHTFEMQSLLRQLGDLPAEVAFVPHSGPFARGIHATVQVRLHEPTETDALVDQIATYYDHTPFVSASSELPSLKSVIGSNTCRLGVAVDGNRAVICSVIDNLVKGAAGGSIQWMNRLLGLPEETGLKMPALGWN